MPPKIEIRPYTETDHPAVIELFRLNTPQFFSPDEEKDLVNYLENEIEEYFVVEHENMVIGAGGINFDVANNTGIISWDILHPDYQGKGIGSALLQHRVARLTSIPGTKTIIVRTSQLTYKFYEKNGFQLLEVKPDYWAKGFDMYRMEYKGECG